MKRLLFPLGAGVVGAAAVTALVMLGVRYINRTVTTIEIREPEPGVKCAIATASDAVALSCWPVVSRPAPPTELTVR